MALISVFSLYIFIRPGDFYRYIDAYSIVIRELFGPFYLWLGLGCVVFLLTVAFSPAGRLKLGGTRPEYSFMSWLAMLYSAGMGAGVLLRAVQEPVFMQQNPPVSSENSAEIIALEYTFYHWGLTAWAFYVFFALVIGYYLFIRKRSVLLSAGFKAGKTNSLIKSVDLLTILTTVTGIVAAVGLGVTQMEKGVGHLLNTETEHYLVFLLALLIFAFAAVSAYRGIDKGIKALSNINITGSLLLLFFIFLQSDVLLVFSNFFTALYHYAADFIFLSLAFGKYDPGKAFLTDWTYYYWAFWLSWAPFTGIFIARISRGRSLRQMILGALLVPALGSFFWFSVFGTSSFQLIESMERYQGEFDNVFSSVFVFLKAYPLPALSSVLTVILLTGFLVTSADSAMYVLSMFTDGGKQHPGKWHRFTWAFLMFLFTEAILLLGAFSPADDVLSALQKLLIITSLPFAFLTVVIAVRLIPNLKSTLLHRKTR